MRMEGNPSSIRWITNSGEAEIFLIFANVDPSLGYKGITCFVVDKEMGIQIAKKEKKVSGRGVLDVFELREIAKHLNLVGDVRPYSLVSGLLLHV